MANTRYFFTVMGGKLIVDDEGNHVLVLERNASADDHNGWALPKRFSAELSEWAGIADGCHE